MNHASILNRVRKAIKKIEDKETASSVHVVEHDTNIDDLVGLVVILCHDKPILKTQSKVA